MLFDEAGHLVLRVIGDDAGGAISPASRNTNNRRFNAARSPRWMDLPGSVAAIPTDHMFVQGETAWSAGKHARHLRQGGAQRSGQGRALESLVSILAYPPSTGPIWNAFCPGKTAFRRISVFPPIGENSRPALRLVVQGLYRVSV